MPNVLEMAARYGNQPNPTTTNNMEDRKWPRPNSTKPPLGVKPNFGSTAPPSDGIPEWKRAMLQKREQQQKSKIEAEKKEDSAKNNEEDSRNSQTAEPANGVQTNGDVFRNKSNYPRNNTGFLNTHQPPQNSYKPAMQSWSKTPVSKTTDTDSVFTTKQAEPDENKPAENVHQQTNRPNRQQRSSFLNNARRVSATSTVSDSAQSAHSDTSKSAVSPENEFPSGGSLVSVDSRDMTSSPDVTSRRQQELASNSKERKSFLHRSSTSSAEIAPTDSSPPDRRRRSLPPHVYNAPPPGKPSKPFNARLPGQIETVNDVSSTRMEEPLSINHRTTPLPPTPSSATGRSEGPPFPFGGRSSVSDATGFTPPPSIPGKHPNSINAPALPARNSTSSLAPSLPGRPIPSLPGMQNFSDRPVPPIPGMQSGSGSGSFSAPSTERPPLPIPGDPPSIGYRSLPPVPNGKQPSLPPYTDRPPLPPPDDRRKESLPNPPIFQTTRPLERQPSLIKTWKEEEEEEEGSYDETPDEIAGSPPPLPPSDRSRGNPALPEIPQEDLEVYEPFEQDTGRSPSHPPTLPATSKDEDKKKKDADKKDKEMRKKFKLPLEGDIEIQTSGTIKCDSKWFEKFSVHAREEVDIVRTTDNPKGKWLVRTKKGIYGYVDSDNIEVDVNTVRQSMHAAIENIQVASSPPLPPLSSPYRPATDPSMVEDMTYDDTTGGDDEMLYEEL